MVRFTHTGKCLFACCRALAALVPIVTADIAHARTETVLYSFRNNGADGNAPVGNLVLVDGTLYGATQYGGASGLGTVFSIDPSTGAEKIVYSFQGNGSDGDVPEANPIDVRGTLYGTTPYGGTFGGGTVYAVDPSTGVEKVVYSFRNNGEDGNFPLAGLIDANGTLYGTTVFGGPNSGGTVFSVNPSTGTESVLHAFAIEAGGSYNPQAGLTDIHGIMYGTTVNGGAFGNGTVFSIDSSTGTYTVLYSFGTGGDGNAPESSLIDVHGTLYGTTFAGGTGINCHASSTGCGTVFSIDPRTGKESVVYSFQNNGADGTNPIAGLIDVNGMLYGTTQLGGASDLGTVYSVDPSTGAEKVVYSFKNEGGDGASPNAGLMVFRHALYGTTKFGGAKNEGTVFKIRL